jgi:tRNA(adenine34) deaminase
MPEAIEHEVFMRMALKEAEEAYALGEVPVGAVVVINGAVIARGHNLRERVNDATAHAEIIALREAARKLGDWRLEEATVYTTIEPCAMCAGALVQFRVKRVVYGAKDPKAGGAGSVVDLLRESRFNHQVEAVEGVMEADCRAVMQRFFQDLRQKDY